MSEALTADRLGELVNFSVDAIVLVNADGVITWANPATESVLGYRADDIVGVRVRELVEPVDHEAWQALVARLFDDPSTPVLGTFRCRHKTGEVCWTEGVARNLLQEPRVGAIVVHYRDVTSRKATEQQLKNIEERYRALVEQSLMGVYIMQNDRLVYVNPKAADLLGYSQQEMIDAPSPFDFVHEQDRAFLVDQLSRLDPERVPSVHLAVRGVRKDGEVIQVEAFCSVTEFGNERAILTTVHDISDRVKLEDQLRQAQKMEAVGRLAGGIAHDFNNLLTAIRGNAELMSHRVKADPEMAAEVDEILHAADRAASLTRQLLAFSRKQVLLPVALDINEIVNGVSRMARRLIGTDVQIGLDLPQSVSKLLADPAQVEQVLLNLIVNARDAMPSGGQITVRTANVRLEAGSPEVVQAGIAPGAFVLLAVTDDGIGMDQATQARIFEPFFTTKETGRGTGLGLSTVYGIIRQTGGAITVTSARGKGACFKVYLPAVTGESQ